ncbi:hypothetical protein B0H14DRAFT_3894561 [Mycena olivaceomarginata]|nr:hypothetical protein B0H14DRAFT_3894561 [Mycena olivaceomarginata]
MSANPQQASFKIKFVVIGGGIAGLTSAKALRDGGHEVVVIEQISQDKTEGSLRSPPNMTRLIAAFPGMHEFLSNHATPCTGLSFRTGSTSEVVGWMHFHPEIVHDLQAKFLMIQHDDLRRQLHSLCVDSGVVFKHGKAMNIVEMENGAAVTLENGERFEADIVVGADGHNSFVRSLVMDKEVEPEQIISGVNISIPTEILQQHEDLHSLCNENEFTIWTGAGSSVTGTLGANALDLSICSSSSLGLDTDMYESRDLSCLASFDLDGCDPRLQKLIHLGRGCRSTVQKVFEQEDMFRGSVVLVGDAAHPVLIHGSHNSSMAIEDAVTLGRLFARLSDRKYISVFTQTYEELRQKRVEVARLSECQSLDHISLLSGPDQEERDRTFGLTLKGKTFQDFAASTELSSMWDRYLILFDYNAHEKVDCWWANHRHIMGLE